MHWVYWLRRSRYIWTTFQAKYQFLIREINKYDMECVEQNRRQRILEWSLSLDCNNLPVAKQWNPNQQGAPQQGSQPGPDQQQGGNSDKPYNAPVVQHTDL